MAQSPEGRPHGDAARLSRRGLLKGTAAAGGAMAGSFGAGVHEATAQTQAAVPVGPGLVPVTLTVNGERRTTQVEPRVTLADMLRERLQLTGTKVVCNRGACSACSVTLNGRQVASCMTLALDADGGEVTTVEGLSDGLELNPVQAAFVRNDAQMCGYCTPGMVSNATALLERNPRPTLDEIKAAMSGNLCRCGTYPKIFAAILDASGQAAPEDGEGLIVTTNAPLDAAPASSGTDL